MKNTFTYLLLLFSLIASTAFGQTTNRIVDGDIFTGINYDKNFIINPEAERNVTTGIISTMAVTSRTSATALVLSGQYSFAVSASTTGQVFSASATALTVGHWGKDCEASFDFRYPSTSVPYVASITSGATVLATENLVPDSANATKRVRMFFTCPDSVATTLKITSSGSGFQTLYFDKLYVGAKLNSGSGSGELASINFVENFDFENSVSTGWTASGATVTSQLYANPSYGNKKYAQVISTSAGQYFETVSITSPTYVTDLEVNALVRAVSGTWNMEVLSGTTTVASQTITVASTMQDSPKTVSYTHLTLPTIYSV